MSPYKRTHAKLNRRPVWLPDTSALLKAAFSPSPHPARGSSAQPAGTASELRKIPRQAARLYTGGKCRAAPEGVAIAAMPRALWQFVANRALAEIFACVLALQGIEKLRQPAHDAPHLDSSTCLLQPYALDL